MVPFILHKGDDTAYLLGGQRSDCRHDLVKGDCTHSDFASKAVTDNAGEFRNIFF